MLPRGMARSGSSRACLGFGLPGGRTAVGVAMPVAGAAPARCTPPDRRDGRGRGVNEGEEGRGVGSERVYGGRKGEWERGWLSEAGRGECGTDRTT